MGHRVRREEPAQDTDERLECAHGDIVVEAVVCTCAGAFVNIYSKEVCVYVYVCMLVCVCVCACVCVRMSRRQGGAHPEHG